MLGKKMITKILGLGIITTSLFITPFTTGAETNEVMENKPVVKTVTENQNFLEKDDAVSVQPFWLANGPILQYPSQGGTWEYGFWNAKVRSYYTVNQCHGSSVTLNGSTARSVDTVAGKKSIAEKWAVQYPTHDDRYNYRVCN